jgi:hypothetical protein
MANGRGEHNTKRSVTPRKTENYIIFLPSNLFLLLLPWAGFFFLPHTLTPKQSKLTHCLGFGHTWTLISAGS